MRRILTLLTALALTVTALIAVQPAGAGKGIAGKACTSEGKRKTSQGTEFVCAKRKGKLIWVAVKAPKPNPTPSPTPTPTPTPSPSPSEPAYPLITDFLTAPSDRLPIDLDTVEGTAPFLGAGALQPHKGIHVYWSNSGGRWSSAAQPSDYPAIYAIADGTVGMVEPLKPMGSHEAYSLILTIARTSTGEQVNVSYSLEPFAMQPSPGFYAPFLLVTPGQQVKKGDVLAYMYVPPTSTGSTHLHLHLSSGAIQSPSIFTREQVEAFAAKFGDRGGFEAGVRLPACMGYKVSAEENPFGTGASDCL